MLAKIPLNSLGKGAGKRMELDYPEESEQREAQVPDTCPGPESFQKQVVTSPHQVGFLLFPRRTSQATPLGVTGILDYSFPKQTILLGVMGCEMCVYAHTVLCHVLNHLAVRSTDFLYCWKETVKLLTQSKDVKNVYCHSCHFIL